MGRDSGKGTRAEGKRVGERGEKGIGGGGKD